MAEKIGVDEYVKSLRIHPAVARVFANRGIDVAKARRFLSEEFRYHDASLLPDVDEAVARLSMAKASGEKVVVFRDYDADGIMGGAVMVKGLRRFGISNVGHFAPNRFETGYGLHNDLIKRLADDGVTLIVTVDLGITAVEEVEYAKTLGVDIIITDHHEPGPLLPDAVAIVNPKVSHSNYPFREICGAAVAWKVVQALTGDPCMDMLDLVATATIADVVPLVDENRAIAKAGLGILGEGTGNIGLKHLLEVAGFTGGIDSQAIGFGIGPRINAVGRLGDTNAVMELFLTESEHKARKMAEILDKINERRRALVDSNMSVAEGLLEKQWDPESERIVVIASEEFHQGVVGIVAGRLLEAHQRPFIVIALQDDGTGKASCRSFGPVDLHKTLGDVSEHLIGFGGHAAAAGLTIASDNVDAFRRAVNRAVENIPMEAFSLPVHVDTTLDLEEVDDYLIAQLDVLAPYGEGNPPPVFAVRGVEVSEVSFLKEKHLKLLVRDMVAREVIAFGFGAWAKDVGLSVGELVDVAFRPTINEFRGSKSIVLEAVDLRRSVAEERVEELAEDKAPSQTLGPRALGRMLFGGREGTVSPGQRGAYEGIETAGDFHTKIAGVSFGDRQQYASQLKSGDHLVVQREPENPYDANAVALRDAQGRHVGYLNASLAEKLAPVMDSGVAYTATVDLVTGGDDGNHLGVNITVQRLDFEEDVSPTVSTVHVAEKPDFGPAAGEGIRFDVLDRIRQTLIGNFDYHPKQMEAIEHSLSGDSVLAVMGTGRGKSAIFQTVAAYQSLVHNKKTIVFYPLKALLNDQANSISKRLGRLGMKAAVASGSLSHPERQALFDGLGDVDILLATPEFVIYHKDRFADFLQHVSLVVVDECHHMSDDRFGYKQLGDFISEIGCSSLLVSATIDDAAYKRIKEDIVPTAVVFDGSERSNLKLVDQRGLSDKEQYLFDLVDEGEKVLVFCNSRQQTVRLAKLIRKHMMRTGEQHQVAYYNSDLGSEVRRRIEEAFASGLLRVVVATSAFGEGVDIPDIRNVVHYHLPLNQTAFLQASGRAGRDGCDSRIHMIFGDQDKRINRYIVESKYPSNKTLEAVYRALLEIRSGRPSFRASNEDIRLAASKFLKDAVSMGNVEASMRVFEDLDLIHVDWTSGRSITMNQIKITDLNNAVLYSESVRDRRAYEDYLDWIDRADLTEISSLIGRPYFPAFEKQFQQ